MQTYISILRGINVSGHRLIKMDALKKMFEKMGFENVTTYLQSGNVVFQCKEKSCKQLELLISGKIKDTFDFEVPVIVKTEQDLATIHKNNPFINLQNKDIQYLHVTFISDRPTKDSIENICGDFGKDEFIFLENVIYLFCPTGYGNSKLTNNYFENKLKLTATTRNWKTVSALSGIAGTLKK